jgi:parallel beta-helix repeat protein
MNLIAISLQIYTGEEGVFCRDQYSLEKIYSDENPTDVILFALELLKKNDGGSIHVAAGEYLIKQPLTIGNNTTLKGEGIATKLKFVGKQFIEGCILINEAYGVTISDLLVSQTDESEIDAGIIVDGSGVCKITNVYAIGFKKYGIWLRNRTFLSRIDGCTVAGNKVSNIYLDELSKDGRYGNFIPNLITNSMIIGGGKGIEARNALVTHIIGCMIHQTNDIAIHLHSVSNSILISGCRTYQISSDALVVEDTDELNVTGNIFSWHEGNGIVVTNSAWGTISGNEFIDTGSFNPGVKDQTASIDELPDDFEGKVAILLKNVTGYHVGGNTIFNWDVCPKMKYGIEEDSLSHNNIITSNSINYFEMEGVRSSGSGTAVANNVSEGKIPYTRLKRYSDKQKERSFNTAILQSYQKELTMEFLNYLK